MKAVSGQTVKWLINFQSYNSYQFNYGEKNFSKTFAGWGLKYSSSGRFEHSHCIVPLHWVAYEMLRMQENMWTKRHCGISKMTLWDVNNGISFLAWHAVKDKCHWCNKVRNNTHISHTGVSCYNYNFFIKCDFKKSLYLLRNRVHKLQLVVFGDKMTQFLLSIFNEFSMSLNKIRHRQVWLLKFSFPLNSNFSLS